MIEGVLRAKAEALAAGDAMAATGSPRLGPGHGAAAVAARATRRWTPC